MKSVSNFNISYIISYKNVNYVGSKSISRVLSWIIICLGLLSPISSSEQPYWTVPSRHPTVPFVLAPDGVYIACLSLGQLVSSYLTIPTLPKLAVYFLLHLPEDHSYLTLSSILALWCTDFPREINPAITRFTP